MVCWETLAPGFNVALFQSQHIPSVPTPNGKNGIRAVSTEDEYHLGTSGSFLIIKEDVCDFIPFVKYLPDDTEVMG